MTKVLITGASGFIGFHLARALAARGDEVTCLVRTTSRTEQIEPLGVRLAYGDVTDAETLPPAVSGNQVVYHLAGCTMALRPRQFYQVNSDGVYNLLQACAAQATPPVVLLVSSLAAAGPAPDGRPRTEADRPVQVSHYGRSKRKAELEAEKLADRLPITVVRPPIVFGEGDRASLPMFSSVAQLGLHIVPGLARHRYSIIHADDLVNLLIAAAERGSRLRTGEKTSGGLSRFSSDENGTVPLGGVKGDSPIFVDTKIGTVPSRPPGYYFAACEQHPVYADLGRMIGAAVGRRRVLLLHTSTPLVWIVGTAAEALAQLRRHSTYMSLDKTSEITAGSWVCSPQAAAEDLGFRVAAPLEDRLRQTAQWYRQEGWM